MEKSRSADRMADSHRPSLSQQGRAEFTFRSARQGPKFDGPAGPPGSSRPDGTRRKGPRPRTNPKNQGRRQQGGTQWRRRPFTRTHDRPLLTAKREPTPERLAGMSDGLARFKALDNISQSEGSMAGDSDADDGGSDIEPQRKKVARGNDEPSGGSGDAVPKWSNPDPYTALPPPDESKGKKTDVVKLIRKARIVQEKSGSTKPSAVEDFISFDIDKDKGQVPEATDTEDQENGGVPIRPASTGDSSCAPPAEELPRLNKAPAVPVPMPAPSGASAYSLDEVVKPRAPEQPLGQSSKKRKRDAGLDGSLLTDWMAKDAKTAKPWCLIDRSCTPDVSRWLHDEIRDFYDYVKPRPFEAKMREDLIQRVSEVFFKRDAMIDCFGSFASGTYLPTADMDLVAMSRKYMSRNQRTIGQSSRQLQSFAFDLEEAQLMMKNSREIIWNARVPLVKYIDNPTRLRVDISFENVTGVRALKTLESWSSEFPAMPVLRVIHKAKADRLRVIDPNDGQNDISGGTKLIKLILTVFSEAHQTLVQRMTELSRQPPDERKGRSILGSIVGGNYTSYDRQREHLRVLASKLER
ncbi:MAG: hypothetical protein Q9157_006936 [Trypethelium eluteriae]